MLCTPSAASSSITQCHTCRSLTGTPVLISPSLHNAHFSFQTNTMPKKIFFMFNSTLLRRSSDWKQVAKGEKLLFSDCLQ